MNFWLRMWGNEHDRSSRKRRILTAEGGPRDRKAMFSGQIGASGHTSPFASAKALGSASGERVFMVSADRVLESGARAGTAG